MDTCKYSLGEGMEEEEEGVPFRSLVNDFLFHTVKPAMDFFLILFLLNLFTLIKKERKQHMLGMNCRTLSQNPRTRGKIGHHRHFHLSFLKVECAVHLIFTVMIFVQLSAAFTLSFISLLFAATSVLLLLLLSVERSHSSI